jgi:hypothetical protein
MAIERVARLVALAVAAFGVLLLIGAGWTPDVQPDADAYWLAAIRLRDGLPLYDPSITDQTEIYRYAPWFAYAWVPLTYLSQDTAYLLWRMVLLAAAGAAVWPLMRHPTPAGFILALLMFGLMVSNLPAANVTTLMVGALTVTLRTRAGPLVLGAAASLKGFPLLFVAGYLAERRWRNAALSVGVAAILWAPVLAFEGYPTAVGGSSFFLGGTSLYTISAPVWIGAGAIALGALVVLTWRGSGWTWLLVAACIPALVPRVWLPDGAYVLVGAVMADHGREDGAGQGQARR